MSPNRHQTHATPRLAEQTLSVKKGMELDHVLVCLNISEILTQAAGPNVCPTLIATEIRLVRTTDARTLAQGLVALMLNVELLTIHQLARVSTATVETHWSDVKSIVSF